jgi:tetratricopeptide (TPR) repeat protein
LPGAKVLAREQLTTPQGLEGTKLVVSGRAGTVVISRFIHVNEETGKAFNATYYTTGRGYEEMEELIDHSFETFRLWDEENFEDDPIFHLDEGILWLSDDEVEAAIDSFTVALELDPGLADAYAMRATAFDLMGEFDLAIADLEEAIDLDPAESDYVTQLGLIYWVKDDLDMALELLTQAINDNPDEEWNYSYRALIRAQAGDFESALQDMEEVAALNGGEIPAEPLEIRAYIYLKMEDYEAAKEDYDEVLAADFKSPYSLLGAGITYARLGLMDEALPLLEYGMELFDESPTEVPYPQLADLLEMSAEYLPVE